MNFGPYRIVGLLGEGGMGVVHLAVDPAGRDVALKVIKPELCADAEVRGRFQREIRLARRLSHPNVVRTYDAGEVEGRLFLSCEWVRGGSLSRALHRRGALHEAQALYVIRDIAAGLEAIASAGMVHRDLKPDNVLLEPEGAAKLSDLGLARTTEADRTRYTDDGQIIGTPAYLAPEQIEGLGALDGRCDLYSAGALLFELLAGRPPFVGGNVVQVLNMHMGRPPPDVRDLAPRVRAEVADLVRALLEKDRDGRPASATEVLARVDRLLEGAPPREPLGMACAASPVVPVFADGRTIASAGTERLAGGADDGIQGRGTLFRTEIDGSASSPDRATFTGRETLLRADPAEGAPTLELARGLDRAKLVTGRGAGSRTLFVYAGAQLRLGRDGIDRGGIDVCLRMRPTLGNEAATRSISGRHLRFSVHEGTARIADMGSTGGTALDGRRLAPDVGEPLRERCEVNVAGALRLGVSVVLAAGAAEPSVVLARLTNGTEHAYALVPERLALSLGAEGALEAGPGGEVDLIAIGGALAVRVPGLGTAALHEGMTLTIGGAPVAVSAIRPEDQK